MPPLPIDRRGFLLAGGATASAIVLVGWPRRILGQPGVPRVGGAFVPMWCVGSDSWEDLSAGVVAPMREWRAFETADLVAPGAAPNAFGGVCAIGVLGAAIRDGAGLSRTQVEIDFTRPAAPAGAPRRMFLAMSARVGDAPAPGSGCRVPTDLGPPRLRLTAEAIGKGPLIQEVHVPLRRGVYALGWSESGRASGRVRWTGEGLESDWPCCVLVSIDPPTGQSE